MHDRLSFYANVVGSFTGTLSVAECLKWHVSPSGGIACDKAAAPQTVGLAGTSFIGVPDLKVLGVVLDTVGPNGPADYRVDVGNIAPAVVQSGVYLEGWWSSDEGIDGDDLSACSGLTTGPIAPDAGVTPVWISCPNEHVRRAPVPDRGRRSVPHGR